MRTTSKQWVFAISLALLLHVLLGEGVASLPYFGPHHSSPSPSREKIRVHLSEPTKQVVKVKPSVDDNQVPRRADYLSEMNHRVLKQTQAARKSPTSSVSVRRTPVTRPVIPKKDHGTVIKRNLLPTWSELEEMHETSDFNDDLDKDLETAAETRLNTFEWKHAAYFNRIKQTVAKIWSPMLQIKRYDPAGALIGHQDRLTVVEITIDPSGRVVGSEVRTSSGVFYLDDEALHAFNQAGEFPNPPKVLFESKDRFSFQFGFAVNIQKGFSMDFD